MSDDQVVVRSGGLGFCGALTILFIALKLTGYISWSWLWVLSPLWLGVALVFFVAGGALLFAAVAAGIYALYEWRGNRRRKRRVGR